MKVLIIGAGAVGQIYGYHFHQGGAEVSYLVKEKYQAELAIGMKLFPLNQGRKPQGLLFKNFQLITDYQVLKQTKWDVVLITVASDALYQPWLQELSQVINPEASILSLQPGMRDRAEIARFFSPTRILTGLIVLIAFPTPLDAKGPQEKGMAWWMPPLVKTPFDGASDRVAPIIVTLNRGGFPSTQENLLDNPTKAAFGSTFLGEFIYCLEKNDWQLSQFHHAAAGNEFVEGLRSSFAKIARKIAVPVPALVNLLGWRFYSLLIVVAKMIMPFDLERYLKSHFTKVAAQMKLNRRDLN
jgi:hypothetical protein